MHNVTVAHWLGDLLRTWYLTTDRRSVTATDPANVPYIPQPAFQMY